MKILINLTFFRYSRYKGAETYCHGLIRALARINGLEIEAVVGSRMAAAFADCENLRLHVIRSVELGRPARVLFEQLMLSRVALSAGADLLFCPGYGSPIFPGLPIVVTLHDTQFRDVPDLISRGRRWFYNLVVPRSVRQAAAVLTMSEFSRRQILHHLKLDPRKVFVTPGAARTDTHFSRGLQVLLDRFRLPRDFILSVSGGSPHKNTARLCAGFMQARSRFSEPWELVIVGDTPRELVNLGLEGKLDGIHFLNYVSTAELAALYHRAGAFVLASLYEGFGLPVLEAMEAGLPVACSHAASLPEVAGDAALLFDPQQASSIAAALVRLVNEPTLRSELVHKGLRNASRFSWAECARQTAEVFRAVLAASAS